MVLPRAAVPAAPGLSECDPHAQEMPGNIPRAGNAGGLASWGPPSSHGALVGAELVSQAGSLLLLMLCPCSAGCSIPHLQSFGREEQNPCSADPRSAGMKPKVTFSHSSEPCLYLPGGEGLPNASTGLNSCITRAWDMPGSQGLFQEPGWFCWPQSALPTPAFLWDLFVGNQWGYAAKCISKHRCFED